MLTQFHELRLTVTDLLHDVVDGRVRSLMLFLSVGAFLIGRSFDYEDILISDASIILG